METWKYQRSSVGSEDGHGILEASPEERATKVIRPLWAKEAAGKTLRDGYVIIRNCFLVSSKKSKQ